MSFGKDMNCFLDEKYSLLRFIPKKRLASFSTASLCFFAPPVGFEPTTTGLTVRCSNQLSYGGIFLLKSDAKVKRF
jgi:hypothetical protein